MKWYYDKNGRYVGMSNCGIEPSGTAGRTDIAPEHPYQVFNESDCKWIEHHDEQPSSDGTCFATTKSGKSCKHKATHGEYCYQHSQK